MAIFVSLGNRFSDFKPLKFLPIFSDVKLEFQMTNPFRSHSAETVFVLKLFSVILLCILVSASSKDLVPDNDSTKSVSDKQTNAGIHRQIPAHDLMKYLLKNLKTLVHDIVEDDRKHHGSKWVAF